MLSLPTSAPGLSQVALRYGPDRLGGAPVICLHGLTRNARDFEDVAPAIAAGGRTVYALTLRGRWLSDYDPDWRRYHPFHYRNDLFAAMDCLGIARAALIGTSLGGIVSMLAAEAAPERVLGVAINDVGPALAPEGIARIAGYVAGRPPDDDGSVGSLDAAADAIRAINEVAFPGRDAQFWRDFARRTFRPTRDGRLRLDYDPAIGRALLEVGAAPDLWAAFAALSSTPTLLIHGALSDLLTDPIVDQMRAARPGFDYCRVEGVGHAPTLSEPAAAAAIRDFVARAA